MRLSLAISTLFFCAAFILAAPVGQVVAAADTAERRQAALVNGAFITGEAYSRELKRVERLSLRGKGSAGAATKKQVLENLIVRELLYQEALRLGIKVPASEVAVKMAQLTGKLSGAAALESTLERMGLSPADLAAQLERGMVIRKFLERDFSKLATVTDDEASFYYQEHQDEFREPTRLRLSHILVKVDPAGGSERKAEGRKRIEALGKRLSAGEDFAALAREGSDCKSADKGGDLGYFLPGQLSRKIEDEARALKPGEASGIVEDRYGLHLLQLTESRPASVLPEEQVREKIRAKLKEEKETKALAPLVRRLRAAASVEILLNEDEP